MKKEYGVQKFKGINKLLGGNMRAVRKAHKVNQTGLAPILGLDQSAYSRVENGIQNLLASQLVIFCRNFKVTAESLME